MNVDTRLQMSLSQRLVMTPMLQQAIKLLQMSRMELVDLVKQELLENPILEESDHVEEYLTQQEANPTDQPGSSFEETFPQAPENDSLDVIGLEKEHRQQESNINWDDYFADNPSGLGNYSERETDETNPSYESVVSQRQSLADHLIWQLQMSQVSERMLKVCTFLIGQLDEDGYLRGDIPPDEPDFHLNPKDLYTYRSQSVKQVYHKIAAEMEREYLLEHLENNGLPGMLARVISQEYYDAYRQQRQTELLTKLRTLNIEDVELLGKFIAELSSETLEALTNVPAVEIQAGQNVIAASVRELRQLITDSFGELIKEQYETKLEKTGLSAEELYLVEYLLLALSAEEVAYVASQETAAKAVKREKDVQAYLEHLQQSYAHIDHLQSSKYFLIQLYRIGSALLLEHLKTNCPPRWSKLLIKLSAITRADVTAASAMLTQVVAQYHETAMPITLEEIEHALRHVQSFAPTGVAARDMKECLCLQARALGLADTPIEPIITGYLKEVQQHQYDKIATALALPLDEVGLVAKIISNMSPKPGSDFSGEPPEYIVPDIYVYKVDGTYEIVLNEDELPYLRINPLYRKLLTANHGEVPSSTKQYVDQKLRSAMWFIRSVEQRKRTISKVGKSIVKFQREFLEHGVTHLKPLVLRDVADDIAMHESTVSRVTTNKYIHTPQGVFELKFFFHSGLESSSGTDVSSIAVKERIKQLIQEEDPAHPLSDKTLEKRLTDDGIAIARRTIAKYREELNLPSSVQRKRA